MLICIGYNSSVGTKLRFYLACNPTKQNNGKRRFLIEQNDRGEWLYRKAEMNGFCVNTASETSGHGISVHKIGTRAYSIPYVVYTGILTVTDSKQFKECLKKGIGSEKAYGLGMLLVT